MSRNCRGDQPQWSGEMLLELVERPGPARLMAVARRLVEELLVDQRQQRAVAVRLEQHGDHRFPFRRAAPCPGEDELLVWNDLAIDAANVVLVVVGLRDDPEPAAHAHLDLGAYGRRLVRPEPAR